jgi:HSP20 family protein
MPAALLAGTGGETEFAPLADVEETDDAFVVEIELAGVKKEDVNVEVSGHRLTVTGERKERQREGTLRRRTRTVGRFRYEMVLPVEVDDKKVEASLDEGVLTIRIPKGTAEKAKRITIR